MKAGRLSLGQVLDVRLSPFGGVALTVFSEGQWSERWVL